MDLTSPRTIRYLKDKYGFRFAKGLGQNFLTDPSVPAAMVEGSGIGPEDLVLEIGPGIGVLTAAAAEAAGRVVAIEVDQRLEPILAETLAGYGNVEIVWADVLKTDLAALIQQKRADLPPGGKVHVLGNLPYYITTPILMKLLQEHLPAASIAVMMQREVADRMEAAPGSRTYGAISVAVQYYCQVSRLVNVPRAAFLPSPKVDSAVLLLTPREERAAAVTDERRFFDVVRAGFGQRRKTISNALRGAGGLDRELVQAVLAGAEIEPSRRAETLSIGDFARIANELTARETSHEA